MRTDVVVIAGSRRGRKGWIFGKLGHFHPLVTKVWVHLAGDQLVAIPIDNLRIAGGRAPEQLELDLETQKKPAAGTRPAAG